MDVGNSFFMVKFDGEEDKIKVINEGLWMIFDHYLVVRQWSSTLNATTAKIDKAMVWIHIPSLNIVYYDGSVLWDLASMVGTPVKVDLHTLRVVRGRFVRVCVEIDLTQPIVGRVGINGEWYQVQYEGLHTICTHYGCYGHVLKGCSLTKIPESLNTMNMSETASPETRNKNGKRKETAQRLGENQGDLIENISRKTVNLEIDEVPDYLHRDWVKVEREKRNNKLVSRGFVGTEKNMNFKNLRLRIIKLNTEIGNKLHDDMQVNGNST